MRTAVLRLTRISYIVHDQPGTLTLCSSASPTREGEHVMMDIHVM